MAQNDKGLTYFQVSQSVLDEITLARELKLLEAIKDHYPKYILTLDYLPDTDYNGIRRIHVLDWLL